MLRICLCLLLLTGLSQARPNYIDLDYTDEDLVKVLRQVSKHLGYNLYLGNEVHGKVTIQAQHVPADGVVALVLKMQDPPYSYYQVGNTLVVGSMQKMQRFK